MGNGDITQEAGNTTKEMEKARTSGRMEISM